MKFRVVRAINPEQNSLLQKRVWFLWFRGWKTIYTSKDPKVISDWEKEIKQQN